MTSAPVLEMRGISRSYGALRPLRIASLTMAEGERVSIAGLDAGAAELLINLATGASLPESGDVRVFGRATADIASGDDWLDSLESFGIVSARAVLLEGSTLEQNLAMPFTLQIDPVPEDVAGRVRQLAIECGIDPGAWLLRNGADLPPDVRVLTHLARALALEPRFLIIEHPTASVPPPLTQPLAAAVARVCSGRRLTTLVLTNDEGFGRAVAPRNLRLEAATGQLKPLKKGWFS